MEMELCEQSQEIETILIYPETRDINYFDTETKLKDFENNVKRFAFPYQRTLREKKSSSSASSSNSPLVQFYTFVLTGEDRIRRYGFCRSSNGGSHVLCMISYLPWHKVFMDLLNKISQIINERKVDLRSKLLIIRYK